MEVHDLTQSYFEPVALFKGYLTAIQGYRCRKCKIEFGIPINAKPETDGCTGFKKVVIEKTQWKSPMRERDVSKKTYPVKRGAK